MPEPTELIITVSPARRLPRVKSMCQDVANATCSAAAASSESSSGTRIRCAVGQTSASAKPPDVVKPMNPGASQSDARPVRQKRHVPQGAIRYGITRSPDCQSVTPSPTARMRPTISKPGVCGGETGKREMPSRMSTSRWFSAHAPTSIRTSPGPGSRSGTSSSLSLSAPPNS